MAISLFAACDKAETEGSGAQSGQPVDVAIRVLDPQASRTALGDVPSGEPGIGTEQSIKWSVKDTIRVWAKDKSTGAYTLNGQDFKFATYNATYQSANFKSTINPMPSGSYSYGAVYPKPKSQDGVRVTYTLSSVQSGSYDPSLDVMYASVSDGIALHTIDANPDDIPWIEANQPKLEFKHLFHLIRIRVPDGKNLLGEEVKQLQIIFPYNVVGDIEFDATYPNNPASVKEWSNLSNKITVNLPDEDLLNANGRYVWLHIFPAPETLQSHHELKIRACGKSGVISKEITASLNSKSFSAGHITPIALTIPESDESAYKEVTFSCPDTSEYPNFLGQDATAMYVREWPTSLKPIKSQSSTVTSSGGGKFKVKFYYLNNEDYQFNTAVANQKITVAFDSANASVNHNSFTTTLPDLVSSDEPQAYYALPYLFFEDFRNAVGYENYKHSGIASHGSDTADELQNRGLDVNSNQNNWTAARYAIGATQAIRVCNRAEYWVLGSTHNGRIDSPNMNRIKGTTDISLGFNYSMEREQNNSETFDYYLAVGAHDNSGTISAKSQTGYSGGWLSPHKVSCTLSSPKFEDLKTDALDGGYNNVYKSYECKFSSRTNSTRFAWEVYVKAVVPAGDGVDGGMYTNWVYLDNIKVSIGGSVKHKDLDYRTYYFPNHTN